MQLGSCLLLVDIKVLRKRSLAFVLFYRWNCKRWEGEKQKMKGSFWCIRQYQKMLLMVLSFHLHRNCRLHRSEIEKKEWGVGGSEADTQWLLFCCSVRADTCLLRSLQDVLYHFCPYSKNFCRRKTWHNRYMFWSCSLQFTWLKKCPVGF